MVYLHVIMDIRITIERGALTSDSCPLNYQTNLVL